MFNSLDQPFGLSNLRYEREVWEILYFTKHHSLTLFRISKTNDYNSDNDNNNYDDGMIIILLIITTVIIIIQVKYE
jgi:hypothetical protein